MTVDVPIREAQAAAKPSALLRFLPSLTDLVFLLPAISVLFISGGGSAMLEGDTGWHVRTGEWILAHGRVPTQDIFSFTRPGAPWYAWEWLWDVAFAWLHAHGGLTAVMLASLGVISATFVLVFRMAARRCGSPLVAFLATWLAMMSSSIHWLARPHLFTFLFTVVFYSILERANEGRTRLLWLLPPLTVLWTNLHGGFLVGLVLIGAYALGELLRAALLPDAGDRRRSLLASRPYLLAGAGCALASLANPYGYQLHVHIYRYLTDATLWNRIIEFMAFNFRHPAGRYVEPLMALALLAVLAAFRRGRFEHGVLILFWAHAGLYSVRNIPIFAIVAAPLAAEVLSQGLKMMRWANLAPWFSRLGDAVHDAIRDFDGMDRPWRLHVAGALAAALLIAVAYAPSGPERFRARYDPKEYPVKAAAALNGLMAGSRVFTDDEWGDYLIYRNYPAGKVFIDGRSDFYGVEFGKTYDGIVAVSHDWEKSLNTYAVDVVLLRVKCALAGVLKESARWRVVYDDGMAIAFRRADSRSPAGEQVFGDAVRTGQKRGRAAANQDHRGS
jgi:hypothetical protein